MPTENRLITDLARMANGALGTLTGIRQEIEVRVKEQVERILGRMDLVRREEFDAVAAMASKARTAQEALEARLAVLEARLAGHTAAGPRPAPRRAARPRAAARKPRPLQPL
ncbi:MAG TPA: accessory factor UbiK family protein [Stellaceae bacterium]|nr:accessory factor UbiK family protein [Stellaceae bacterium]